LANFLELIYKGGDILVMSTLGMPGGGRVVPLAYSISFSSLA